MKARDLTNPAAAALEVSLLRSGWRLRRVKEYLAGTANPDTEAGRVLLHRRALFVTELRRHRVLG